MAYGKPAVDIAADLREAAERLAVEYAELIEAVDRLPGGPFIGSFEGYKEAVKSYYSPVRAAVLQDIKEKTVLIKHQKEETYKELQKLQEAAKNAP